MVKKLLYLNGLSIIAVVLYHASGRGFISLFWWAHRYRPVGEVNFDQLGNGEYYLLRLIEQLAIFAIPAFIFVSGYFIAVAAGRSQKTIGWKTVANRIKVLAIPFIIWSIISLLYDMTYGVRYSPLDFVIKILSGTAASHFYFIPLLVQLYLLSPLLVPLARSRWKFLLTGAAGIQVLVLILRYFAILRPDLALFANLSKGVFFTSYTFWFVLGIVFGFNLTNFKKTLERYKRFFLASAILLFVLGVVEWEVLFKLSGQEWIAPTETLIDQFFAFSVILSLLAFDNQPYPWFEQVKTLGTKSYGIYLIHSLALMFTSRIIYNFVPSIMEYQILFQPILISVGLATPLLLMFIIERSRLRKYYIYLFG